MSDEQWRFLHWLLGQAYEYTDDRSPEEDATELLRKFIEDTRGYAL